MKAKHSPFERAVLDAVERYEMLRPDGTALVALSGGPDSTALLVALAALAPGRGMRLRAFHVDHGLRGAESEADCRAARALSRGLGIPFRSVRLRGLNPKTVSEDELRERRFAAIEREAVRVGADAVFLGHHAGDLAETLLMRLCRGAGLEGLAAFGPVEERAGLRLLRPLIECSREEILEYLAARKIAFRTDRSNEDERFLRNRVRRLVLPLLAETANPRATEALARAARLLRVDADFLERLGAQAFAERVRFFGTKGGVLSVAQWKEMHEALRSRVMRAFCRRVAGESVPPSSRHIEDLDRFALLGRKGTILTGWGGLAFLRERDSVRAVCLKQRGRPTRAAILAAVRAQLRADPEWRETPARHKKKGAVARKRSRDE